MILGYALKGLDSKLRPFLGVEGFLFPRGKTAGQRVNDFIVCGEALIEDEGRA